MTTKNIWISYRVCSSIDIVHKLGQNNEIVNKQFTIFASNISRQSPPSYEPEGRSRGIRRRRSRWGEWGPEFATAKSRQASRVTRNECIPSHEDIGIPRVGSKSTGTTSYLDRGIFCKEQEIAGAPSWKTTRIRICKGKCMFLTFFPKFLMARFHTTVIVTIRIHLNRHHTWEWYTQIALRAQSSVWMKGARIMPNRANFKRVSHPRNIELVQGPKNEVLPSFSPSLTNLKGKLIFLCSFFRKHPNVSNCSRINQLFIFLEQRTPADK